MDKASYKQKIQALIDKSKDHVQKLKNINDSFAQSEEVQSTLKNEYYGDTAYESNGEKYTLESVFDSDEIYDIISSYEGEKIKLLKNIASSLED